MDGNLYLNVFILWSKYQNEETEFCYSLKSDCLTSNMCAYGFGVKTYPKNAHTHTHVHMHTHTHKKKREEERESHFK